MNIHLCEDKRKELMDVIVEAVNQAGNVYIYGAALTAHRIADWLSENASLDIKAFVVDDRLKEENLDAISFSDYLELQTNKDVLVCGFASYEGFLKKKKEFKLKRYDFNFVFIPFPFSMNIDGVYIDRKYYLENEERFSKIDDMLLDVQSKELLSTYIDSQITGDLSVLQTMTSKEQYFIENLPDTIEVYIDCGGYDGDTMKEAFQKMESIGRYYIFEPDTENYNKINDYVLKNKLENVTILKEGVWDKTDYLHFSSNNSSSSIDENGDITVEVTTIDDAIEMPVENAIIKMDIEGSELKALRGGEKFIKSVKPYMAICVYHKRDDLIEIPSLIQQYSNNGYNFMLRYYGDNYRELVLYCLPKQKTDDIAVTELKRDELSAK